MANFSIVNTDVVDTSGKFATGVKKPAVHLLPVSTTPVENNVNSLLTV
jgi:hypothetical protein